MKQNLSIVIVVSTLFLCFLLVVLDAAPVSSALRKEEFIRFEEAVAAVARQYIGTPYGFGKSTEDSGAVDNSHLFHLIYGEAAHLAGLRYLGYAPMHLLLDRTFEVPRKEIRPGDLIVLDNGLAAMIYRVESPDLFHMIYVSKKRQQVISFNSRNVVYEAYWLKHLRGFYRLTPYNFSR